MQRVIAIIALPIALACMTAVSVAIAEPSSRQADWQNFLESYQAFFADAKGKAGGHGSGLSDAGQQRFVSMAAEFYRQDPSSEIAYEAMLFVLSEDRKYQHREEICRNLRTYHIRNPRLNLALSIPFPLTAFSDECEQLFKNAVVSATTAKVRDTAKLQLSVVYQKMTWFLANTTEFRMKPQAYITSKIRSSFSQLPAKVLNRINQQFHNRSWLNYRWQVVWERALRLAKASRQSPHPLEYYRYYNSEFRQAAEGSIGDMASNVYFQLERGAPGVKITDFNARDLDGKPVSFAQYKGKVIVLDVWATWCEPCVKGLPDMRALQKSMRGRPFQLITLSIDRTPQEVKSFMRRYPMPFANWYIGEDQNFFAKWPVWPIPKLYVIDEKGTIRSAPRVGHQDLAQYIDRLVTNAERTDNHR